MPEIRNSWKSTRKDILNLIYFILSTGIVVGIWPYETGFTIPRLVGVIIIVASCYLILYLFLSHFRSEVLHVTRKTLFIILMILSFIVLTRIVTAYMSQRIIFLIPFVIIPFQSS